MADLPKGTEGAANQNPKGQETDPKLATPGADAGAGGETEVLTLSKAELEKLLQSETDKRVTSALKTNQAKWQAEYDKRVKEERQEAEKLAKMSEEERRKAEDLKREQSLTERERALNRKEMELAATKILDEKKLPIRFATLLLGNDADETHANIEEFEKTWREVVESAVGDRLKGTTPKGVGGAQIKKPSMNDIIRGQARKH